MRQPDDHDTAEHTEWLKDQEEEKSAPAPGSALASRESVALLMLLRCASLMRITIKERATFLTKTTDWERLEDAMRSAERALAEYTHNTEKAGSSPAV